MTNFKPGIEYAKEQDLLDPLAHYRTKFHIPKNSDGEEWLYFTGNSLGLQPKDTKKYIQQELDDWAKLGVEGHFEAKNPWMPYHEFLTETMSEIVGAKPIEVVIMNTLTTNLHLLMVSFYQPSKLKHKILIESDAFPSDRYAVETQLRFHGFDPSESLIEWSPRKGETLLNIEDLESILQSHGDEIALLLIGGVNYYTGQYLDLKKISELGHEKGCKVGIDLAHGVGNIQPNLHESGADFAAWCTYKYMNSGARRSATERDRARGEQRGQAGDERFNRRTGGGYVAEKLGDYSRAVEMGVTVVPLLMETFGGCAPRLMEALLAAAEWRANKLTSSEYDETTWSARTWLSFVSQRISVAAQLAAAQEVAEALGLAVAADPRAQ